MREAIHYSGVRGQIMRDDHVLFAPPAAHGDTEAPLNLLIEAIPTAVFIVERAEDPIDWVLVAINALHQALSGLGAQQGKSMSSWCPASLREVLFDNYRTAVEAWEQIDYVERLELPGGVRWWHTTLMPIRTESGLYRIVGSAQDISHQRQTESALSTFMPICSLCKAVQPGGPDEGADEAWVPIEQYLHDHQFSHGFCTACFERLYAGLHSQPKA